MKLDETTIYPVLKGVSLSGCVSVQSAGAQWLLWESWIWCELESCLFLGCFVGYHLVKRWGWRWSSCGHCLVWAGPSPLLIHQNQLPGVWLGPTLLEQKPRALSLSWLFPLSVGVLPTPTSVSPASGVLGRGCSSHSSTVWDRFMQ